MPICHFNRVLYSFFKSAVVLLIVQSELCAQTLDEQYEFYLADQCANLNFEIIAGSANELSPGQAGPNLSGYCGGPFAKILTPPGSTATTSSNGSAPSTDGAGDGTALRRRNEELRDNEDKKSANARTEIDILSSGTIGLFLSLDSRREDKKVTKFEAGSQSDNTSFLVGLDKRFGASSVIGLAYSQSSLDGKVLGGGDFDKDSNTLWFYGSWFPKGTTFIDLNIGMEDSEHSSRRLVGRQTVVVSPVADPGDDPSAPMTETSVLEDIPTALVEGSTKGDAISAMLNMGYDYTRGGSTFGPRLSIAHRRTAINGFTETGSTPMSLRFHRNSEKSLIAALGIQASRVFGLPRGVITVQANLDWQHEFENKQKTLTAQFAEDLRIDAPRLRFLNEAPDKNWFTARLGSVAVFPGGLSAFASLERSFSHAYLDMESISVGLRQEF